MPSQIAPYSCCVDPGLSITVLCCCRCCWVLDKRQRLHGPWRLQGLWVQDLPAEDSNDQKQQFPRQHRCQHLHSLLQAGGSLRLFYHGLYKLYVSMHSPRVTCVYSVHQGFGASERREKHLSFFFFFQFLAECLTEQNYGGVCPTVQECYKQDHKVTLRCSFSCHCECITCSAVCSLSATVYFCLLSQCCSFYTHAPSWFMPVSGLKKRHGFGLKGHNRYKGAVMAAAACSLLPSAVPPGGPVPRLPRKTS